MTRILILLLLAFATPVLAQDDARELAAREARLEALQSRIGELGEALASKRERAGGLEAELARLEQRIGEQRRALSRLDASLARQAERIADLRQRLEQTEQQAAGHRQILIESIRAMHRQGGATPLRLLLGESDPARLQRLMAYQRRLGEVRGERLEAARAVISRLSERRKALQVALEAQRADRERRAAALAELQRTLGEREALLASLRGEIESDDAALAAARDEAASLRSLIDSLRDELSAAGPMTGEKRGLDRGRLDWPVEGPLLARFGSERVEGLNWTGLLIGGEAGAAVHPVAPGQVVFADWLRGVGLLLIIDHGEGYLSLYGRNQALYFDVGDWVDTNDVIATVGRSGGRPETALYFELRAGGEPVDPLAWLPATGNRG
jgi:septal ring factor EnvC (AmiA/AmiB activator)